MSDPPTANAPRYNLRTHGATSMSACVSPSLSRTPANPVTSNQTNNHRPKKRRYGMFNLYQLSNDPDRRIFSEKLIMCHIERGTPIIECPKIRQLPLDLYEVYLAVKERGGFVEVTKGKMWEEITGFIGISASSCAADTLKCLYIKHLLPFECKYDRGCIDPDGVLASSLPSIPLGEAHEVHPMPGFDYKVLQDLINLLLSGEFSDVIIQVEDQQFKAHRSILAARSSVFAAMFRHDMKEKATGIVNVKDCELSSFPVFLEYLYCGSTEKLSSENVFHLYVSADKYDIQDLKKKCLEFMKSNLTVDTIYETLQIALQHSDTDLLNFATGFFIRNLLLIIPTTKWETFRSENPKEGDRLFKMAKEAYKRKAC